MTMNCFVFDNYNREVSINKKVIAFFTNLGYKVGWDADYRLGDEWHEIIKNGHLICQIDTNVPLDDIIADIIQFHQGKEGVSNSDYRIIGGPDTDELKSLFEAVYNFKINNILPNGQMLFSF